MSGLSVAHALIVFSVVLFFFGGFNALSYWALKKAGRNPWLCLAIAIPLIGLIPLWLFAFGKWPNESDNRSAGTTEQAS